MVEYRKKQDVQSFEDKEIVLNFHMKEIDIETAKNVYDHYEYAIVHMLSDMQYGKTKMINVNWKELVELRAFTKERELHVFDMNGILKAICLEETGCVRNTIDKRYVMRNGRNLWVREYLDQDEDGQAIVRYTRPFAMEV